ncbi:hypothetical protein CYMTET_15767, partial [Cymbomonas tetramitiformis]
MAQCATCEEQAEADRIAYFCIWAYVVLWRAMTCYDELDDAVRRRLEKRIYIPLPDAAARARLLSHLLDKSNAGHLAESELKQIVAATEGYSGSDLHSLAQEAAMEPLRELGTKLASVPVSQVRAVQLQDFNAALQ